MVQSIGNKGDDLHFCVTDRAYRRENFVDALPATGSTDNATGSDDAALAIPLRIRPDSDTMEALLMASQRPTTKADAERDLDVEEEDFIASLSPAQRQA